MEEEGLEEDCPPPAPAGPSAPAAVSPQETSLDLPHAAPTGWSSFPVPLSVWWLVSDGVLCEMGASCGRRRCPSSLPRAPQDGP